MATVLDTLTRQLTPETVTQIGRQLGADNENVRKGIEVGLPLLLSALAENTASPQGAEALSKALKKDHDGSVLARIPDAVDQYQSGDGGGIVRHVLGDKRQKVEGQLSKETGLDAGSLLQILAPLLLGALGKTQREQGLDPGGLSDLLQKEQQQIGQNDDLMGTITSILGSGTGSVLVGMLLQQFIPQLAALVSEKLGVDEATARKGITIAIPLLLMALARNSQSPRGADAIADALKRDHDGSVLNNPRGIATKYETGEGAGIVRHVFGEQRQDIEELLTQSTGLDGNKLLQILAPAVMGALGKAQQQQQLDSEGVAGLLEQEKQQLQQEDSDVAGLVTRMLDSNKDGSLFDDVVGWFGKLFR